MTRQILTKKSQTILALFMVLSQYVFAQSWTKRSNFPNFRYAAVSFVINDTAYVGTGSDRDFWKFDQTIDTWIQIDSFPGSARSGAISFVIGDEAYLGGGATEPGTPRNDFWKFDPQTNKWTQKADIPVTIVSQGSMSAFSIGIKGYVYDGVYKNLLQYNSETNIWSHKANYPGESTHYVVSFALNNRGYIGPGAKGAENTNEFWEYNPDLDQWTRKADFPGSPRNGAVAFTIENYGYIGLGNSSGEFPRDFWRYNPEENSWNQVDSCGYAAHGAFAFSLNNKGYVGTGVFIDESEFWEYTPRTISIEEVTDNKISLYPNPVSDIMYIKNPDQKTYTVNFYNLQGKRIKAISDSPESIQTSDLSKGIYLLEIIMDNTRISKTFIKN